MAHLTTCVSLALLCIAAASRVEPVNNCTALALAGAFTPYVLRNANGVEAHFIPFGAAIQRLYVPDTSGVLRDVVLGFDDPESYCSWPNRMYFGAVVGRVANRIGNCSFPLGTAAYNTSCNEYSSVTGRNDTLHGGFWGYDRRPWAVVSNSSRAVTFSLADEVGSEGFPGSLAVTVTYTLEDGDGSTDAALGRWSLDYAAVAGPVETVCALSNHAYWNLNANVAGNDNVLEHELSMPAGSVFAAVDGGLVPTGALPPVSAAPWLDFTAPKTIGRDIRSGTVAPGGGYDNAWVLSDWNATAPTSRVVASLASPVTRIRLTLATDQPSVQFYSGNGLDGSIPRKADQVYGPGPAFYEHWGTAVLEAQHVPDTVHHPNFPGSVTLGPGEAYAQHTSYAFALY